MKLLIVSDLHYALPQFDWVLSAAPDYDAVVVAGDLLDAAGAVAPAVQIVVVVKYLEKLRRLVPVIVCSGNHDLTEFNAEGEKWAGWMRSVRQLNVLADGDTGTVGDALVTVCAWWDGPLMREAIGRQLAVAAERRNGRPWFWLYHAPPGNSPISTNGHRFFGDPALEAWIEQYRPTLIFSGHVHESPFVRGGSWVDRIGDTFIFNAGRQIGPMPTHVAIDTEAGEAAWFSFEGAESVRLDAPLTRPLAPLTGRPAWMRRA